MKVASSERDPGLLMESFSLSLSSGGSAAFSFTVIKSNDCQGESDLS